MYYIGTSVLNMSDEKFWRSSPRMIIALFDAYKRFNGLKEDKEEESFVYVDQVSFL